MRKPKKKHARLLRKWVYHIRRARRTSLAGYERVYADILQACQSDPTDESQRVVALVKPWKSSQILRGASDKILIDLIAQAHALEQLLNPKSSVTRAIPHLGKWVVAFAVLTACSYALAMSSGQEWDLWLRKARVLFYDTQGRLSNLSLLEQSGALAVVLVVVGTYLLRSTRTS